MTSPIPTAPKHELFVYREGSGGFLAQLITDAGLGTPHVVAPDLGTAAALFAAVTHRSGLQA
jgi:hypothetical protein